MLIVTDRLRFVFSHCTKKQIYRYYTLAVLSLYLTCSCTGYAYFPLQSQVFDILWCSLPYA